MAVAMQYGNSGYGTNPFVGMSMTLLWTNPDTSSAFAAQTVSLELGGYNGVLINFVLNAGGSMRANSTGFVGEQITLFTSNASTTSYTYKRYATITTSGVTFSTGYRNTTAGTSYAVPCKIYGLKKGNDTSGSGGGGGGGGGGTGTLTQVTFNGVVYSDDGGGNVDLNESDPVFLASDAYSITSTDITNWNNKADSASLATVATSGSYNDLSDTPTIHNVPSGGATGQVLAKSSGTDYDTTWAYRAPIIQDTASGAIATFSDGLGYPFDSIVAEFEPVQDLSNGDPSPTNICPITGHTAVKVTRTGKNLVNVDDTGNTGAYIDNLGVIHNSGSWTTSILLKIDSSKSYVLSGLTSHPNSSTDNYRTYDKNKNYLSFVTKNINTYPVTFSSDVAFVQFCWKNVEKATVMFEQSSSATTYEAYNGTSVTVSLGGTYYGGTLNVTTGVLTVTDDVIASYAGESLPSTWISDRDVYAEGTTPTTGAQVVYKLSTPTTVSLTAQSISTLSGTNYVWADTGNITVTFPADTKTYIDNAIATAIAAL